MELLNNGIIFFENLLLGSSDEQLFQPSGIAVACSGCRESDDCTVYVLDAGNERIAKYSRHLQLLGYLRSSAVAGHSATGMCATQCGTRLWIANWKLRSVMEVASDSGAVLRTVSLAFMKEPVDVALNSCGHLLIADAERATVYVVELLSSSNECRLLYECGSRGGGPGQFQQNTLRTVTSGANDDVVAADATRIQIFSRQGKFIRSLSTTIGTAHIHHILQHIQLFAILSAFFQHSLSEILKIF